MSQIENADATADISVLPKYDIKSSFNDEIKQNTKLKGYVRNELEKILPTAFTSLFKDSNYTHESIKIKQEECCQNLNVNLEQEMSQYSISEDFRKQMFNYAQSQLVSRLKVLEAKSIMTSHCNKMIHMADHMKTRWKQHLHELIIQKQITDRSSAIARFEDILKDDLSEMEKIFNDTEKQWTQIIKLIFEVYQALYYDTLLSFDDAICYLPFLISRTSFGAQASFYSNLIMIRNECTSKVQYQNSVDWDSNYSGYQTFNSKLFKHFQYIDGEKLNDTWSQIVQSSSKETNNDTESNYHKFCQEIFSDWSLFIKTFSYFDLLTEQINEIFNTMQNEETVFEIKLIQKIISVANTLIKDINLELKVFQMKVSTILHKTLHVCAIMFISLFYYDQEKTYFNKLAQSVKQNQQRLQNYFLTMTAPSELDDTNMANNFTADFCDTLLRLFNQQSKEMIETLVEEQQSTFTRLYFINQLNDEVYDASDDWLISYILQPMTILNEKIDQQCCEMKICIDQVFMKNRTFHFQLLNEFFEIIAALSNTLQSDHISFSDNSVSETLKTKQTCIVTLFYQYFSGESNEDDLANQMSTYWKEIKQQWPQPSEQLKQVFRSMKNEFEMYGINNFAHFLDTINQKRHESANVLADSISRSMEKMFETIRKRLLLQARGCTVQCPCCRRLCDVDHDSNEAFAIGQGDNRHCCWFGHQIQGMGDVCNAVTYKAMTLCCEKLNDADEIVYRKYNLQQNWLDVKSTHTDWDFTESYESQVQEKISVYIWNKIGQRLCQHYKTEREHSANSSELVSNHFILLCGYSVRSNSQKQSFFQRLQQHLTTVYNLDTTSSARKYAALWNHMPEILNDFFSIRGEKNKSDRITIITNSSNNVATARAVHLNEIKQDQITQIFSDSNQCADFSAFLKKADRELQEIQNDPKLNTLQHTIIFMIGGDLDTFPLDDLTQLHQNYHTLMKTLWTIALRDEKVDYVTNLNNIMHGTLCIVDEWYNLHDVCLKISAKCSSQNLNSSTQQETPITEETNSSSTLFEPITTSEQNRYSDKIIIPSIPEEIIYDQICQITFPFKQEDILRTITGEILSYDDNILIPLPNFSKRLIDYLPKINIELTIERDQFNLKEFLKCFAQDIDVDENDLCVIEAEEGSIRMVIAPLTRVAFNARKMNHINDVLISKNLPATRNFVALQVQKQIATNEIVVALDKFNGIGVDQIRLTPEIIDHSLRRSHLMTVLNKSQSQYLRQKSQQISNCLIHAFRECSFDFSLEHALLIYNETLMNQYKRNYGRREDHEKILFHGTRQENFEGIFQNNFQYNANVKRTDVGWYGQGIYFSSSPRKALNYAKSWKHDSIVYIICSIVALGKSLTITNMKYKGKPMHSDYDSHYVRTSPDGGQPISNAGEPYYEEFVIKKSGRILPLFIVGIQRSYRCAIWRDLRINNEANDSILADLRRRLPFNIYESKTSEHSLNILKSKFFDPNERMKCAIITNGADEGQQFAIQCRTFKRDIPIVVYCKSKAYHRQWAVTLGEPEISVTSNPEEVFQLISNTLALN